MKKDLLFSILTSILTIVLLNSYVSYSKGMKRDIGFMIPKVVVQEYGLPADQFQIEKGAVGHNESLSTLLAKLNISAQTVDSIVKMADGVFDLRKIRSGKKTACFFSKDSTRSLQYFVYEHSPTDFLTINLNKLDVQLHHKDITVSEKVVCGSIRSSLWISMEEVGIDPSFAAELADVFAWSIDFFGLQKGDSYKVIYEEKSVDNTFIGFGKIKAAYFMHEGRDYYAFRFKQDSIEGYYDEKGQSQKKIFLKAPLKLYRITSTFAGSRFHPILKIARPHYGVDYAAPTGTPVYTIGEGTVLTKGWQGGYGNCVRIRHAAGYETNYAHMSAFAPGLSPGKHLQQGDLVGFVGQTGLATGPHLDFRCYHNGTPIDPQKVSGPPKPPVKPENMVSFNQIKNDWMARLKQINNSAI